MTGKILMWLFLCLALLGILALLITESHKNCEKINVCSYEDMRGKVSHTEYVSCNDLQAESISQMCVEDAPQISLLDWKENVKREES